LSTTPAPDPACSASPAPAVDLRISARPRDLGGFSVRRVLPAPARRRLGPFVFFDHMGPNPLSPEHGMDVRPHPHVALATLTYLFAGAIVHRDSLGSHQVIRPGDVNWMVAGRGIMHSERASSEARAAHVVIHGIQSWVALPKAHEETEPRFEHHPGASLPRREQGGVALTLIAGDGFGMRAPVGVFSRTLYADAIMTDGALLTLPTEHPERGVYVAEGELVCDGERIEAGTLAVLRPDREHTLRALGPTRVMVVGGEPLDGERYIEWNFVASSEERIARAKDDYRAGRFPRVPGDEQEFIPLPG
jgi:redox-sensitive bicupin YhaK (pirin superfamily)